MVSSSAILNARILVVDDQKAYVLLLERMLRGAGYVCVDSTTEPSQVCELHGKNRYDLILLDVQMPGMDGFQVMESLKDVDAEGYASVIVITAQPEHRLRALKVGAKDFVNKPYDLAEVLIRVRSMLESHLLHLETKKLHEQLLAEHQLSEQLLLSLLLSLLPQSIAQRVKEHPDLAIGCFMAGTAERSAEDTVLFADIVSFAKFAEGVSVDAVVNALNDMFTRFDRIAGQRGAERIKTIGAAEIADGPALTRDAE